MSSAPVPPPAETPVTEAAQPTSALWSLLLIIPLVFVIIFHLGAGYLSYQKFGSILWAILDVIFAGFYYPYYAFVLSGPSAPTPMMGVKHSILNLMKMKW